MVIIRILLPKEFGTLLSSHCYYYIKAESSSTVQDTVL